MKNATKKRILSGAILITFYASLLFLLSGCMSRPSVKDYPESMTAVEKKLQFKYDNCVYAQSFNKKVDLRCYNILADNQKIEYILYYNLLKDEKKLPILYRKSSSEEMTFDDFFKYIK